MLVALYFDMSHLILLLDIKLDTGLGKLANMIIPESQHMLGKMQFHVLFFN